MACHLGSLPPEMICDIADHLTQRDTVSLMRSARWMHNIVDEKHWEDDAKRKGCALKWGAWRGRIDIVERALAAGSDMNHMYYYGCGINLHRSALFIAIFAKHWDVAKLLLARGADVQLGDSLEMKGTTLFGSLVGAVTRDLHRQITPDDHPAVNMLELLRNAGARPELEVIDCYAPGYFSTMSTLHFAMLPQLPVRVVALLLHHGANATQQRNTENYTYTPRQDLDYYGEDMDALSRAEADEIHPRFAAKARLLARYADLSADPPTELQWHPGQDNRYAYITLDQRTRHTTGGAIEPQCDICGLTGRGPWCAAFKRGPGVDDVYSGPLRRRR